jgi:hypothetical protein
MATRILAGFARRQQHATKAETICGDGDFAQVARIGRPMADFSAEIAAVATGRNEPEEIERVCHVESSLQSWATVRRSGNGFISYPPISY